ncbi:MAG: NAD-dependent epimerase/dehydratase family protein [Rhodospirillales bacterium]
MSEKRALITGANGMTGGALTRRLLGEGYAVTAFLRPGSDRLRLDGVMPDIKIIEGDMCDLESLASAAAAARPDTVFHLAGTLFNPPTIPVMTHLNVNTVGAVNLIQALEKFPGARIVYTATGAVYGSAQEPETSAPAPATVMGAAKAAAGLFLQTHARITGRRVIELRPFTPYGPWERPSRLIPAVVLSALDGVPVKLNSGVQKRDYFYIDDLLDAFITAAALPGEGPEIFNIGGGEGIEVRRIAETVLKMMGDPVKIDYKAHPERADEIMDMSANLTHTRAVLGWGPRTSLDTGLRRTIGWITENADLVRRLR